MVTIEWGKLSYHYGNPMIESVKPFGYTIISVPTCKGSERIFYATYAGKEPLPQSVGEVRVTDPACRKDAVASLKRACADHYSAVISSE